MGWAVLGIIIVAVLWYLIGQSGKRSKETPKREPNASTGEPTGNWHHEHKGTLDLRYLQERWTERIRAREAGEPCVPRWWWDEPSEAQLKRLADDMEREGLDIETFSPKTKGSVSDIIGWFEHPSEEDAEFLTAHKVPLRGMSQTRARYERRRIENDPAAMTRLEQRPASSEQKEALRWFGESVPSGMLYTDAAQRITEIHQTAREVADPRIDEWDAYQAILGAISDPDERDLHEIRKPSKAQLRKVLDALVAEGNTYRQIEQDFEIIARRLPQAPDSTRVVLGEVPPEGASTPEAEEARRERRVGLE